MKLVNLMNLMNLLNLMDLHYKTDFFSFNFPFMSGFMPVV